MESLSSRIWLITVALVVTFTTVALAAAEEDSLKSVLLLAQSSYPKVAEQEVPVIVKAGPDQDPVAYPCAGIPVNERWIVTRRSAWTSGFMTGCFWRLHQLAVSSSAAAPPALPTPNSNSNSISDPATWRRFAEDSLQDLWPVQFFNQSHDVGFMVFTSFGNAFINTLNSSYIAPLRNAAQALASRFSAIVGCTRSWNSKSNAPKNEFLVIIDNIMNLELLFWVGNQTADRTLIDKAISHANRSSYTHVRPDGSTWQVVSFNELSGQVITKYTVQGLRNDSTWARGQAWAIYGFTMAYRYTLIPRFLRTAQKTADFFIRNVGSDDKVPFWDFDAAGSQSYQPRDTSAAAIAAAGMLELSGFMGRQEGGRYRTFATELLRVLAEKYRADGRESYKIPAILVNGTAHYSKHSYDTALIFGDYYYLDALLRLHKA